MGEYRITPKITPLDKKYFTVEPQEKIVGVTLPRQDTECYLKQREHIIEEGFSVVPVGPMLARVTAMQTVEDFSKLVKDKPAVFYLYLYLKNKADDGLGVGKLKIDLEVSQGGNLIYKSQAEQTRVTYKNQLYARKISNDEDEKKARLLGEDAVEFGSGGQKFVPAAEGKILLKVKVTDDAGKLFADTENEYDVKEQKETLNILLQKSPYAGNEQEIFKDLLPYRDKIYELYPIAEKNINFTQIGLQAQLSYYGITLIKKYNESVADAKKIDKCALVGKNRYFEDNPAHAGLSLGSFFFTVNSESTYVFVHELGHTYDLHHPWAEKGPVSGRLNPSYMQSNAANGWSLVKNKRVVNTGDNLKDFMDYFPEGKEDNAWINTVNYSILFDALSKETWLGSGTKGSIQPSVPPAASYRFYSGQLNDDGTGLEISEPVILNNPEPVSPGAFRVESIDAAGVPVYSGTFSLVRPQVDPPGDSARPGIFYFTVPNDEAAGIRLYYRENLIKEISAGRPPRFLGAPAAVVDSGNVRVSFSVVDEDSLQALAYSIYFRGGALKPWRAIAFQEKYPADQGPFSIEFPQVQFAGADQCQVRVEVSDGYNVVESEPSNTFNVAHKAPITAIASPQPGAVFRLGRAIALDAFAFNEEGEEIKEDNAFAWSKQGENSQQANLGNAKELMIDNLTLGRYVLNLTCADQSTGLSATDSLDIEVDNIDNPDISVLGIDMYSEVTTPETTQVQAKAKLFNVREQAVATVKAYVNGVEVASFSPILLPANKITELPVAIDTQTYGTAFDLKIEVTDTKDEATLENNSFTVQYPVVEATPSVKGIYLYPDQQSFPQDTRLHIISAIESTDGREVTEYLWKLDGQLILHNNKAGFALNLANLTKASHTLSLTVKDSQGSASAVLTKSFNITGVNTLADSSIEQGSVYQWYTYSNSLNNSTGWVKDEAYSGERSLKLVNTNGANSGWRGLPVNFSQPYPTTLTLGGFSKAEGVNLGKGGLYCLDFKITFSDDTVLWYVPAQLRFTGGTHGWENREITKDFGKPIKSILPYGLLYYNATGTVWFDDLYAYKDGDRTQNLLINPDMEAGIPLYWYTNYQDLNNSTGWVKETSVSGERSAKIVNTQGANSYWAGPTTAFSPGNYPTTLTLGGYSKAENVNLGIRGLYCLDFYIQFADGTALWYAPSQIRFSGGTHDWENREITKNFGKPIKSVRPLCLLYYGATGSAWFDDVYVYRGD